MPILKNETFNTRTVVHEYLSYSRASGISMYSYVYSTDRSRDVFKYKSWVRTPNYRLLVEKNEALPENTFSHHTYRLSQGGGSIVHPMSVSKDGSWSRLTSKHSGSNGILYEANPSLSSLNRNALVSKLVQAAKGSQWNVPVFIAEGRKTVDMVVHAATQLVLMARALRRGDLKGFRNYAHPSASAFLDRELRRKSKRFGKDFAKDPRTTFSSYWLQWKYGWVPFMLDVQNATNTLMDTVEMPSARVGSVYASVSSTVNRTMKAVNTVNSGAGVKVYANIEITEKISQRATWKFASRAADLPGRFGLLNPLLVAWELVPLSFVADWFLPVGSYLESLDTPARFTHLGGSWGASITKVVNTVPTHCIPSTASFSGFSGGCDSHEVLRTPMTAIPQTRLKDLTWEPKLSIAKMVTSLALLHTFFGKKI